MEGCVDEIIFTMQAGNNKHEHIIESMTLFAKEVMPEFKERRPEIEARKAERLAPTLERLNKLAAVEEHPDLATTPSWPSPTKRLTMPQ